MPPNIVMTMVPPLSRVWWSHSLVPGLRSNSLDHCSDPNDVTIPPFYAISHHANTYLDLYVVTIDHAIQGSAHTICEHKCLILCSCSDESHNYQVVQNPALFQLDEFFLSTGCPKKNGAMFEIYADNIAPFFWDTLQQK